ncbi:unnamed protein product [Echinostoma caproni]|uniref:Uncharacterized protein n=1 Tax=Echinostoma caproni TaxID=27848 RepID=A0A183BF76_9TREM|nr:unnamed protein product [Echinostoma caproni]
MDVPGWGVSKNKQTRLSGLGLGQAAIGWVPVVRLAWDLEERTSSGSEINAGGVLEALFMSETELILMSDVRLASSLHVTQSAPSELLWST